MVKVHNILDLWEIGEFIGQWHLHRDAMQIVRNIYHTPNCYILSPGDKSIYFFLEGKTKTVGVMHIYVDPKARGKKMFDFIKEVIEWGKENTEFRFIFNYTKDRKVKRIMPYFGSKKIGEWRGETVYRTEV